MWRNKYLLHDFRHELGVTVDEFIDHLTVAYGLEMLSRAVDLELLYGAQLQRGEGAFRLGDEVDVLHCALLESDGPVGIVIAYRRGNVKAFGELHIDGDLIVHIQMFSEFLFIFRVVDEEIIEILLRAHGVHTEAAFLDRIGENIRTVVSSIM